MKIARIALLVFGVGMIANATADRRQAEASFKLGLGAALLAAYELLADKQRELKTGQSQFQPFTKPPRVKPGILPGKR